METSIVNIDRSAEIKAMAEIARKERIRLLTEQLERDQNANQGDMSVLELDTLEMKALFDSLMGFNQSPLSDTLAALNWAFQSYAKEYPHMATEAIGKLSDLNQLIAGLSLYSELIERKFSEYTKLADELNDLESQSLQKAS
jgi:hypothetical protein